jgi:hypothetical protein
MAESISKSNRKRYLVNGSYQIRHALKLSLLCTLMCGGTTWYLNQTLNEHSDTLEHLTAAEKKLDDAAGDVLLLLLNLPETNSEEQTELRRQFSRRSELRQSKQAVNQKLIAHNANVKLALALVVFVLIAFVFIWSIISSHRIAGPLYVLKQQLIAMRDGKPISERSLRKNDEFQDVYTVLMEIYEKQKGPGSVSP